MAIDVELLVRFNICLLYYLAVLLDHAVQSTGLQILESALPLGERLSVLPRFVLCPRRAG